MMDTDRCTWALCKRTPALRYLERLLCPVCWERVCNLLDTGRWEHVARMLKIDRDKARAAASVEYPATELPR